MKGIKHTRNISIKCTIQKNLYQSLSLMLNSHNPCVHKNGNSVNGVRPWKFLINQIQLWFTASIFYTQLSASCLLSIICRWTPARHTSDSASLRHFLCWSIFSECRRPKNHMSSCVPLCCIFFSGDRNPRQTLTKRQHPSSHLEDEGRRPKQYKQHT